jgi:hypothetical protein
MEYCAFCSLLARNSRIKSFEISFDLKYFKSLHYGYEYGKNLHNYGGGAAVLILYSHSQHSLNLKFQKNKEKEEYEINRI